MTLLGIDVSEFQGHPDWAQVARSGVAFAFARVAYGDAHADLSYEYNRAAIRAAGIVPGAYHYLTAAAPASQADMFASLADPLAIHALDVEAPGVDVASWVARYRQHYPSKRLLIYTGRDLWSRSTGGVDGARFGPLWAAGVIPNAYLPGRGPLAQLWARAGAPTSGLPWHGWTSATFLQFSCTASVPGVVGDVDGDAFFGSLAELQSLTGGPVTAQPVHDPLTAADAILVADTEEHRYEVPVTGGVPENRDVAIGQILDGVRAILVKLATGSPVTLSQAQVDQLAAAVVAKMPQAATASISPADVRTAVADVLATVHA